MSGRLVALCAVLVSCAVAVSTAQAVPVQDRAGSAFREWKRKAQKAPGQAWGDAEGRSARVPGRRNTEKPQTLSGKYPPVQLAKPVTPSNRGRVETPTRPGTPTQLGDAARPEAGAQPGAASSGPGSGSGSGSGVSGFVPGESVEVPQLRERFSRSFANPDGTVTTAFSSVAVNTEDAAGKLVPVEPGLVRDEESGEWRKSRDEVAVSLAPRASSQRLARVELSGGLGLEFGLDGARPVAGRGDGDGGVRYAGVGRDVDLHLEGVPGGLKEDIVLRSPDTPRRFVFSLRLDDGLRARLERGDVLLENVSGERVGVIPAGFMVDSRKGAAGPARSEGVRYGLEGAGSRLRLVVELDDAWLSDPARVYPVMVDPTVADRTATTALRVSDDGSAGGGSQFVVGRKDGVRNAVYLGWPSVSSALQYHTIYGVQLQVVSFGAPSCKARPLSVHPVTGSWSSSTSTTYPGPAVGAALASKSFAYGYLGLGQSRSACPAKGTLFNLGTGGRDLVQGWVNGTTPNRGLSLRASGSDSSAWKQIVGLGGANEPTLFVTHSPYNAAYKVPNPNPNPPVLKSSAGKVKITVTNKSAASWTPSTYKLVYRAYEAKTGKLVKPASGGSFFTAASLPGTVARGAKVSLEATIAALPVGSYVLDFSMATAGGKVFTDEQVPPARLVIQVFDVPPVLSGLYPANGYQAQTLQPQLWARAQDLDATPGSSLSFSFQLCDVSSSGSATNCTSSGFSTAPAWTPPSGRLVWGRSYLWRASVKDSSTTVTSPYVTLLTNVPQPPVTSSLAGAPYGSGGREFDPQVGNFTTAALEAPVVAVGPPLRVTRSYNSLDPRVKNAFGAGWSSVFDMRVVADDDGTGNVVVTYPDGQQARFGRNADGSYATPQGRSSTLRYDTSAQTFTLTDGSANRYVFDRSGRLLSIYGPSAKPQTFSYSTSNGRVQTITNGSSGRKITVTWSGDHVASVATDAVNGTTPTWTYTYDGDLLRKVCAPDDGCTVYDYAPGSHYRSGVLDTKPESYYRLHEEEDAGSGGAAGSEVAVNLGKDSGTYSAVTLGVPGALAATDDTAASFDGSSSVLSLPNGLVKKSRDGALELWFKTSASGVAQPLAGYQAKALSTTSSVGQPLLYVGTDGRLRGQFRTGSIAPITSSVAVNDGKWHHAVLSAAGATQTLYLDGAKVGSLSGKTIDHVTLDANQIGAAYTTSASSWPAYGSTARRYFNGVIDEVAVYQRPLGPEAAATHYRLGSTASAQLSEVTLPGGQTASRVVYDTALNRVAEYTDGNGGTWKLGAPAMTGTATDLRRRVVVLDPNDQPYLYEYDGLAGRLVRTGTPDGTGATPEGDDLAGLAVRTYVYDDNGFMTSVTNEVGATTSMTYDARGNVTSRTTCRTSTSCQTSWSTYPSGLSDPNDPRWGLASETRDPRSASATDTTYRTRASYDAKGNLLYQITPDGLSVLHTYSYGGESAYGGSGTIPSGLLLTSKDVRGKITTYSYYPNGDLAQVKDPLGVAVTFTYDALGRRVSSTETTSQFPDGVSTTYTYDAMSRVVSQTGPVTTDAVTGAKHQQRTTNRYDTNGNLLEQSVQDVAGSDDARVSTFEYDEHARMVSSTDPEGNETSFGYDELGNRTFMVDPNGTRFEYTYTARNQLVTTSVLDWDGDPDGVDPPHGGRLVTDALAYDDAGRLVERTDAMGRTTRTEYYDDDLVKRVVLADTGYVLEENTYDAAGNRTRQVAANGTSVTDTRYDALNRVTSVVENPDGPNRRTYYTYGYYGDLTKVQTTGSYSNVNFSDSVRSQIDQYTYDAYGRQVTATQVKGSEEFTTKYAYDQRGQVVAVTDPRGTVSGADPEAYTTSYGYDELGRRITTTAPPVAVESGGSAPTTTRPSTSTGYNAFGEPTSTKDPLGKVAATSYDKSGRPVATTGPAYTPPGASTPITSTTRVVYDGVGNVVSSTDARGARTEFTYDRLSRLVSKDTPLGTNDTRAVWRYTYTRSGQVLSVTAPNGAQVRSTYDEMDRPLTQTQVERYPSADNFTTRFGYDNAGNLATITSPSGAVTTNTYDALGQLIKVTDPNGVTSQFGYDPLGYQIRISDGAGRTSRPNYDVVGRLISDADLDTSGTQLRKQFYEYDPAGNLTKATSATGQVRTYAYDALNRLTKQVEPVADGKSITTSFGYDAAGNRTRYTDGRGNTTVYTLNALGLPESVIEPATTAHPDAAERTWTAVYDAGGLATKLVAPGGVSRTRVYDTAGRLKSETGTGAEASTTARTLGYDDLGRLTSISAAAGAEEPIRFTYDDRGNLRTATGPAGTAQFTYNADGQLAARSDAAGTATFGYTKGRLTTLTDAITGSTQTLAYDNAGLVKTVSYGSGRTRALSYDKFGRLETDVLKNSTSAVVASVSYGYDLDDHVTQKDTTGTAGATQNTYSYDQAGRLTGWTAGNATTAYAWDDSGNRIMAEGRTATFDERNRMLTDGKTTYTYTPRGTIAKKTVTGAGGTNTESFTFDAFDRLITQGSKTYTYDGLDRLAGANGTAFSYAGASDEPVSDGTRTFARGPADELLAVQEAGTKRLTLADLHGDVIGGFDPADTGLSTLTDSTAYDPFGKVLDRAGDTDGYGIGYQGEWTDPDTGDVDMGARWYDPDTGRFDTRDTVTYASGPSILANRYTYAAGDPMTQTDPDGHWPSCGWCKKAGSAVKNVATSAARSVGSAASWVNNRVIQPAYNFARNAAQTAYNYAKAAVKAVGSAARWVANKATAGFKAVTSAIRTIGSKIGSAISSGGSWAKQRAQAAAQAAHRAAVRVTEKAKQAAAYAAKHVAIPAIKAAVKPVIAGAKSVVAATAKLPAQVVSVTKNVVTDISKSVDAIYQEAVTAVGNVAEAVSTAAQAVGEFAKAAAPMMAEIAAGIAIGVAVGAACAATVGVGCVVAAAVIGGALAAGGAYTAKTAFTDAQFSWGGLGAATGLGAIGGLAGHGLGKLAAKGASSIASRVTSRFTNGADDTARAADDAAEAADNATPARACPRANSFTATTPVLMAGGTLLPIKDIKVGDKVIATDPETGQTSEEPVTHLLRHTSERNVVTITINDGTGDHSTKITATDEHPFWNATNQTWTNAIDLKPGTLLQTGAGTYIQITAVQARTTTLTAYNLTIDNLHTYYAGTTPVLTHNQEAPIPCEGEAIVHLDRANGHASISVTHGGQTLHSEQVGTIGTDARGAFFRGKLGSPRIDVRFPLKNPGRAQAFQRATEDHSFGPYELDGQSCVTYCIDVLSAGGVDTPDAREIGWQASINWILGRH